MNNNIVIPKNDIFFYGISLNSRDSDIRSDIFSNIIMKYLTTLKPVTGKLYRSADNAKYEYSYTFVPSKPISWRVIKNRSIIEDIERLTDGKYCLNYYDDNGNDVKRVIISNQHKWIKTNYYNSIYGESLVCSLIPKELNAETVILQYITGDPYPVTLRPCPTASNDEILTKVLERCPAPEATALTNYGLLYFACEETYNIFSQILKEEEEKYKEAHKPPVYNTQEDVAGGFCFDVDNFDSTKSLESRFDLSEAMELTEELTVDSANVPEFTESMESNSDNVEAKEADIVTDESSEQTFDAAEDTVISDDITVEVNASSDSQIADSDVISSDEYSIDDEIALAIKMISEATSITIDEDMVLSQLPDEVTIDSQDIDLSDKPDTDDIDSAILIVSEEPEFKEVTDSEDVIPVEVDIPDEADEEIPADIIIDESEDIFDSETEQVQGDVQKKATEVVAKHADFSELDSADLLRMDDDAIDDYVSSLIDNLLMGAQTTVNEYNLDKDETFTAGSTEIEDIKCDFNALSSVVEENPADSVIESNGAQYYYYGDLNESGERTGRGRTLMSDGKLAYDGEYLNDMRHGKGSFYYKDGSLCFYGDWYENMRNGFGVGISSETGIIHTGNWSNNKPKGIGVRFDSDGNFMYLDSASDRTNGGIRIVGFGEKSIFVEVWNEKTLKVVKKEIFIDDLMN